MLTAPITKSAAARWGPERRLEFIDFRLLWDGTINRGELVNFFGISMQQASCDLARYAEMAPRNLSYDKSAKTYRAAAEFKPLLAHSDAQYFLTLLAELTTGTIPASSLYIGWRPPCDVVRDYPDPPRYKPPRSFGCSGPFGTTRIFGSSTNRCAGPQQRTDGSRRMRSRATARGGTSERGAMNMGTFVILSSPGYSVLLTLAKVPWTPPRMRAGTLT